MREGFQTDDEREQQRVDPPGDIVDAVAVEAAPQEPAEVWPIKVRLLHRAIRDAKGNEIRELSFRQPSGGDINRIGMPVRVDSMGEVIIDERKMTYMMTALSGVMTPFLETMDPRDWSSCAYRLRSFFLPDPGAW